MATHFPRQQPDTVRVELQDVEPDVRFRESGLHDVNFGFSTGHGGVETREEVFGEAADPHREGLARRQQIHAEVDLFVLRIGLPFHVASCRVGVGPLFGILVDFGLAEDVESQQLLAIVLFILLQDQLYASLPSQTADMQVGLANKYKTIGTFHPPTQSIIDSNPLSKQSA